MWPQILPLGLKENKEKEREEGNEKIGEEGNGKTDLTDIQLYSRYQSDLSTSLQFLPFCLFPLVY